MIATSSMSPPTMSPSLYASDASLPIMPSDPAHGFQQLRDRYPKSALVSELVQAQEGQFVVCAIVQIEGTPLASALASASQVEVAEDRARARVLSMLGISSSAAVPMIPKIEPQFTAPVEAPTFVEPFESQLFDAAPTIEVEKEPAIESAPAKKTSRKKKEELPAPAPLLSFDAPEPVAEPEPLAEPEPMSFDFDQEFSGEMEYSGAPDDDSAEAPIEMEPDMASEPIDLSDAIAQIGTEIERIGWTKKQGSTYLQETYSKKTRAELTEDELLEFLHYLKALPSKGYPSMSQPPF